MKIKIQKKELMKNLEKISKAINSNSHLQSLKGILFEVKEKGITLLSSNGNLCIKKTIQLNDYIKIEKEGKILIPGVLFLKIIKKLENEIELETKNNSLIIKNENSKWTLQLMDESQFPIINFENIGKSLFINSDLLKKIIDNVSFAASDNDNRIILNGINLKLKNNILTATATNSFRLAMEKKEINSNIEFDINVLSKNFKDFIPEEYIEKLEINVNDSKIITINNNTIISSKLIDGVYPEVEKLIPKEFKYELTIDSKNIIEKIEKAIIISEENNKIIKLNINKEKIFIESKKNEIGEMIIGVDDYKWNNEEFSIIVNADFLRKAISKFKGEVKIKFNGPFEPIVINGDYNKNLIQLVLPHRNY